jgi:hypothetical protein
VFGVVANCIIIVDTCGGCDAIVAIFLCVVSVAALFFALAALYCRRSRFLARVSMVWLVFLFLSLSLYLFRFFFIGLRCLAFICYMRFAFHGTQRCNSAFATWRSLLHFDMLRAVCFSIVAIIVVIIPFRISLLVVLPCLLLLLPPSSALTTTGHRLSNSSNEFSTIIGTERNHHRH